MALQVSLAGCRAGSASLREPVSSRQRSRGCCRAARTEASLLSATAEEFASGRRKVELIVSDVDGTLLNPQQQLTAGTRAALQAAAAAGVPIVVATGKALGPWTADVLPHLGSSLPQIYLQGLLINCHREGVLYQQQLEEHIILEAVAFADEHGVTLTAYCGDRIVCRETDEQSDRLLFYKEPPPESVGPLERQVGKLPISKLIFMNSEQRIAELRPAIEQTFAGRASLTTAIPGMLEVLPLGASKGVGVSWLLDRLGVDPAAVMALGDGENDKEMLELCGLGVAMGNAAPAALSVSDAITAKNAEDGVARAVERFVLGPRGLL
ncbi:haloacid dehalogenase-like hydrolase [Chlorella sorokiniana]|uniref:Haloacid dehalogenase-like hydrolase n=1 Tax=Chlorella sorokiniana TaxID=3076 RepID=A0A2P6TSJ6_CHLSO|nr:haloacid dehalogenase-like hydrolase [Chlorella sorokiniana]|eukprot:PRW57026.1 haloacid dehalogenase-like hydrolase [Chlorella sorokiniana]